MKMLPQEHCDGLFVISILHFNQIECEKVSPLMAISSVGIVEFYVSIYLKERFDFPFEIFRRCMIDESP